MRKRPMPEVHIEGFKELSISGKTLEYLNPKSVFLPTSFPSELSVLVKPGDKVKLGQKILMKEGRFGYPILSPISGTVKGSIRKWHPSNKMLPMIEIENDFTEDMVDTFKGLDPEKMSREELINVMKESGLLGMGGAGFPTYAKYETDKPVDTVIINLAECEPFITCDYTYVLNNPNDLIYGLKYMIKASDAKGGVIALKNKDINNRLIDLLTPLLENNMSLFLLHDVYPAGWERYIVETVTGKTYGALPIEAGVIVNNATTAITFGRLLKEGLPPSCKYMTVTGDAMSECGNVLMKFGTSVHELLALFNNVKEDIDKEKTLMICGGPMTGNAMFSGDFVTSPTLGSTIALRQEEYIGKRYPHCLGCGTCAKHCPVNLSPYQIKRTLRSGDVDELIALGINKCIQCGQCSYVCPSHVELTSDMLIARDLVRKMKR